MDPPIAAPESASSAVLELSTEPHVVRAAVPSYAAPDGLMTPSRVKALWGARCGESARRVLTGETSTRGHAGSVRPQVRKRPRGPGSAKATASRLVSTDHRVCHDKLMARIAARISDRRVLKLIRAFLAAGVMESGLVSAVDEGVPQGGPLSPLLSNLVLDEWDRELERRGHRFVRYADDSNVYVRSERAGQRVMASLTAFITRRLKLKVNQAKSAVARPWQRKFLGFSFTSEPQPRRRIAPQAVGRFKKRVRELTGRQRGVSLTRMVEELSPYLRGWQGYFGPLPNSLGVAPT